MPVKADREYRSMDVLSPSEEEKYIVEGYATTFDSPYLLYEYEGVKFMEVIERSALDGADFSDVLFLYNHEGRVYARNKNKTLILTPDAHGLHVRGDLSLTTASREMYEEIKTGLVDAMSWAFIISDQEYDKTNRTRIIKKIKKVFDVSAVSYPANPDTEISARSFAQGRTEAERLEELERRKKRLIIKALLERERMY